MKYEINLEELKETIHKNIDDMALKVIILGELAIAERLEALVGEVRKINDSLSILALRK